MSEQQSEASPLAPIGTSPLVEADPGSLNTLIKERIDEIFNLNPLPKDDNGNYLLTEAKLQQMVDYYRKERVRFLVESQEKEAKAAEKGIRGPRKAAPKSIADALKGEDLL
jgi:hypothetical protein